MCLAVPGRVQQVIDTALGFRVAKVEFGGTISNIRLDFVPEADVGDYVMVHVGFALSRVNAEEADQNYRLLEAMGLLRGEEWPPGEEDGAVKQGAGSQ
jgi:hydrogenase expression/formation protein HypC